jgi:hypothetical protein
VRDRVGEAKQLFISGLELTSSLGHSILKGGVQFSDELLRPASFGDIARKYDETSSSGAVMIRYVKFDRNLKSVLSSHRHLNLLPENGLDIWSRKGFSRSNVV